MVESSAATGESAQTAEAPSYTLSFLAFGNLPASVFPLISNVSLTRAWARTTGSTGRRCRVATTSASPPWEGRPRFTRFLGAADLPQAWP
jgi:hypothetical protein